ncbi:F-box/kelch-repeat protein At3g61590-like isoform X2 [Typha angustifolia]|uniref:F-box/kelch-repeat protein At3g61590-like isoform X2 n=1 Tax=Typha angustifolia TaxID=59011 RepID=UPI003C2C1F81
MIYRKCKDLLSVQNFGAHFSLVLLATECAFTMMHCAIMLSSQSGYYILLVVLLIFLMDSEEWKSCSPCIRGELPQDRSISEDSHDEDRGTLVSLDTILPDDLLEKIFSFLPIVGIIRSGSVCRRWYNAVHSGNYKWSNIMPQKPWYFMFTCSEEAVAGYVYDPSLRKWYSFKFPCIEKSNWSASCSCGLVCLMDSEQRNRIFVCNPITTHCKRLQDAPGGRSPDYSALAISVNRKSQKYTVVVAKCKQVPEEYYQWDISIHIYESESSSWVTPFNENLVGWRGGDECVICNGVLYYLVYSTGVLGNNEPRHCLVMYDLSVRPSCTSLMSTAVPVPCSLTCGRLMNLRDRLIMVGGIGKPDRPGIIKGIGIWELSKKEWHEVARMPHKFFQGFGEFDDVFASTGTNDLIYVQSYGSPALLTFDMGLKLWKWSVKSPVTKRFPLQLFTGFCFEPRLDICS